ncbi:unnamed protein product [Moneuplotes crassus]|uniref:Uncharacterized protein n=1 Tax=Euplotes crassus TaxID=5936 RepID=A0AAD1XXK0_EUPCR|nr:unnamed protein product [Moneuplotes crassus]
MEQEKAVRFQEEDPLQEEQKEEQIEESKEEETLTEKFPDIKYTCGKCRKVLFRVEDLETEHNSYIKKFNASTTKTFNSEINHTKCTSWFINEDKGLALCPEATSGNNSEKINCPHCKAKLGCLVWSGAQCSCGRYTCPAFQIHKSKVDEIKPIVFG